MIKQEKIMQDQGREFKKLTLMIINNRMIIVDLNQIIKFHEKLEYIIKENIFNKVDKIQLIINLVK
jgi:hypothetical protein